MDTTSIVIVGGGAGGLELASRLGRRLGPRRVTLVDAGLTHIWKPSLHEVAAGTLDIHQEGLSYLMLAHDNGFSFVYGRLQAVDPVARQVTIGAVADEHGDAVLPERHLPYGSLVLAIGSVANHFGVPGAAEHTISLDGPADAERFRLSMLRRLAMADQRKASDPTAGLDIVIIGGGATGVELAAELREASTVHSRYGFTHIDGARDVRLTLLEGAPRILAPLPEEVSAAAARLLAERRVTIVSGCRVTAIDADGVTDQEGRRYPADLCVWAAGIKAPPLLATLGLATTRSGQLDVDERLQVRGTPHVYALGDCAACPQPDGRLVPPRAQAAHQQADYLYAMALRQERGQPPSGAPYRYRDHGSLVSLGTRSSVGSLMGNLFRSSRWFVDGVFARMMYASLHLMHHQAVLGTLRTAALALARFLVKRATPLVKLH